MTLVSYVIYFVPNCFEFHSTVLMLCGLLAESLSNVVKQSCSIPRYQNWRSAVQISYV